MHVADTQIQITPPKAANEAAGAWPAALPRPRLAGQRLLLALIGGVTWLAFIGAWLGLFVFQTSSGSHTSHLPAYYAYDLRVPAPTSFGSLTVTRADLTNAGDTVNVQVSVNVVNTQDGQIDAPRVEDLRIVSAGGTELGKPVPGAWSGPASVLGHSVGSIEIAYTTPSNPGLLWLEYRDRQSLVPIRVALGTPVVTSLGESA